MSLDQLAGIDFMVFKVHLRKRDERNHILDAISSLKRVVAAPDVAGKPDSFGSTVDAKGVEGFLAPLRDEFPLKAGDGAIYRIYTSDSHSAELLGELLHRASLLGVQSEIPNTTTFQQEKLPDGNFQLSVFIQSGRETRFLAELEQLTKKLIDPSKRTR